MKVFFLFPALFVTSVLSWDQIWSKNFRTIFPYANELEVWKLTFQINRQNNHEDSKRVLNAWIDLNWFQPNNLPREKPTTNRPNMEPWEVAFMEETIQFEADKIKWKYQALTDKEFARHVAIRLLEHRNTIKLYIRFLYRSVQEAGVMNREEAETMRQNFWEYDRQCGNGFECTYRKMNIRGPLLTLTENFRKLPPVSEKMDWDLYSYLWFTTSFQ